MRKMFIGITAIAALAGSLPALAADRGSSGHQAQTRGTREIPHCTRNLGTIAIVEPDNQWWRD